MNIQLFNRFTRKLSQKLVIYLYENMKLRNRSYAELNFLQISTQYRYSVQVKLRSVDINTRL